MKDKTEQSNEKDGLRLDAVICFACLQGGADSTTEVWETCQECRGNGEVMFEQKCSGCGGKGERWEQVNIHKHCI